MAWWNTQPRESLIGNQCRHTAVASMLLSLSMALSGCAGPGDQKLITNGTQEAYRASLLPIFAKMTLHEEAAFDWAVSDLDLAKLNEKYPGGSPKEIIRGEVGNVLATYPGRIAVLKQEAARAAPVRDDLRRIEAKAAKLSFGQDFFGPQPQINAVITNHSSRSISRLQWRATLFLNDETTPVAQAMLTSDFRNKGGLKPGDTFASTFTVGFVKGDERWTTLEIQNAAKTRVVLEPVFDSILDFGDRPYLEVDSSQKAENMNSVLEAARSFSDI